MPDLTRGDNVGLVVGIGSTTDLGLNYEDNYVLIEALLQPRVTSILKKKPDNVKSMGEMYVVPEDPTNEFAEHRGDLAIWDGKGWYFIAPKYGFTVFNIEDGNEYFFNDNSWAEKSGSGAVNVPDDHFFLTNAERDAFFGG